MKRKKPTKNNYFSPEMDRYYFSASQVKSFMSCEARTLAQIRGEWNPPPGVALLTGSFVDAAFEGPKSLERFKAGHPELYNKRDGTLKADYRRAADMVVRARQDPLFMEFMRGQKQKILTGQIDGIPFKCKLDVFRKGERIVDLKTTKDMQPIYKPGEGRLSFADYWLWPLQMAIYQYIEGNKLPCYLAVITKEDPPDIAVIQVEQEKMDAEMDFLRTKLPRYDAIKRGLIEPERCENCAYCRATKKLSGVRLLEEFNDFGGTTLE